LCNITLASILADEVIFVGAGDITILIMAMMAMTQPRISALTVILQVSNLDNMETGSPLVLLLRQQEVLGSKVIVLVGLVTL
jgi:hypothetical protein